MTCENKLDFLVFTLIKLMISLMSFYLFAKLFAANIFLLQVFSIIVLITYNFICSLRQAFQCLLQQYGCILFFFYELNIPD